MNLQLQKRFDELEQKSREIVATTVTKHSSYSDSYQHIEEGRILGWCVNARHLLTTVCGKESEHFKSFVEAEESQAYEDSPTRFKRVVSVFSAAKEDFEGGYLTTLRTLVQAEVFTVELEQADELLSAGYHVPAAVIAGVVLETTLRDLCVQKGLPVGQVSRMNEDLAKAGQYNSIVQKQIVHIAAMRNSAAHGKTGEFTAADVRAMVRNVEGLLAGWLS